MFHNMLITAFNPLSNTNQNYQWNNPPFTTLRPAIPENVINQESSKPRKHKPKRVRTCFTREQLQTLQQTFEKTQYITRIECHELAQKLGIGQKCVQVWFQNRRMKEKKKSSESSDSFTEAECSSTSDIPEPVSVRTSREVNMMFSNNEYVLPTNVGRNLLTTPALAPYDTGFPDYTNLYPIQCYPKNITAYNDSAENQNYNQNNYAYFNNYDN